MLFCIWEKYTLKKCPSDCQTRSESTEKDRRPRPIERHVFFGTSSCFRNIHPLAMVNAWPSVNAWEIWSLTLLNPVLSGAFREAEATHANRNLCCLQCLASWICLTYQIDPKPINPLIKLEK